MPAASRAHALLARYSAISFDSVPSRAAEGELASRNLRQNSGSAVSLPSATRLPAPAEPRRGA